MIGTLNTVNVALTGAVDNEVREWNTNIINSGGFVGPATLKAVNNFIHTLKVNNIRNKIRRCNLFCGASLVSALHPIITSSKEGGKTIGNKTDVNHGFLNNGIDYKESNGLHANGTTLNNAAQKWLEPDVFISSADIISSGGHLSFMSTSDAVAASVVGDYMMPLCGGDYSNNFDLSSFVEFANGQVKAASPSAFEPTLDGHVEVDNVTDIGGFWVANRTSNTSQKLYKNGIIKGNEAVGNLCPDDVDGNPLCYPTGGYKFRIFGAYSSNQIMQTSTYKLLFYSMGKALSESEIGVINEALEEFNKALGRS